MPGESHGQRHLADSSPRGRKESDTTEVTTQLLHRKHLEQSVASTFYGLPLLLYLKILFIGLCWGTVATDRLPWL